MFSTVLKQYYILQDHVCELLTTMDACQLQLDIVSMKKKIV